MSETNFAEADDAPVEIQPGAPTAETTFRESQDKEWNGKTLRPWSWDVKTAANLLEMRYGAFTKEDVEEFQKTGSYPGILRDVMVFLYLGTCPDKDLSNLISSPNRFREPTVKKMMKFAEDERLEVGSENFYRGSVLLFEAIAEDAKNQFKIEESTDPTPGN